MDFKGYYTVLKDLRAVAYVYNKEWFRFYPERWKRKIGNRSFEQLVGVINLGSYGEYSHEKYLIAAKGRFS